MEQVETAAGGRILYGTRDLVGRVDDYREPVGAIIHMMSTLLYEYAADGGNLENFQIVIGTRATPGRVSRPHAFATLHGYNAR